MAADGGVEDVVVQIHRGQHVVGEAAEQGGAAHYIGGENRAFPAAGRGFGADHGSGLRQHKSPRFFPVLGPRSPACG
jgi:hypothetical protein